MLSLIVDMALGACVTDVRKLLSENERNAAVTQTTSSYIDLTTTGRVQGPLGASATTGRAHDRPWRIAGA